MAYGCLTPLRECKPVISDAGRKYRVIECRCSCGSVKEYKLERLRSGHTKSCGCGRRRVKLEDIISKKYNSLTVIGDADSKFSGKQLRRYVKCKCDCGNECKVFITNVTTGVQKSCGCRLKNRGETHHSFSGYKEITGTKWCSLKLSAKERGIDFFVSIEDIWNLFLKQERRCALTGMELVFGNGKSGTASLDRIKSNLPYYLENVQWVHRDINYLKMDIDQDYFIKLCKQVAERN